MAEILVAQGSSLQQFQNATPAVSQLNEGTVGRVEVEFPGGGLAGDLAGAEQIWGNAFAPHGVQVIDVEGQGVNRMVVHFVVPYTSAGSEQVAAQRAIITTLVLIGAIAGVIAVAGWAISRAALFADSAGDAGEKLGINATIIVIAILVVLLLANPDILRIGGGSRRRSR